MTISKKEFQVLSPEPPGLVLRVLAECWSCGGDMQEDPIVLYDSKKAPSATRSHEERADWWARQHDLLFPDHLISLTVMRSVQP